MSKKHRGNPNWGRKEPMYYAPAELSEFEKLFGPVNVDKQKLNVACREWARRNKDRRYAPERLLEVWGWLP